MLIRFMDCKKQEILTVKVDVSEYVFIVAPEIKNHKFDYLRPRLMDVRAKYMKLFLQNTGLRKEYEKIIYNEMRDVLIAEAERIHRTEGIMYYTI